MRAREKAIPAALRKPLPIDPRDKLLLSYSDLRQLTGLSLPTLRREVSRGMPSVRVGERRILFRWDDVLAWMKDRAGSSALKGGE